MEGNGRRPAAIIAEVFLLRLEWWSVAGGNIEGRGQQTNLGDECSERR